jgi:hypothetical protein
MKMVFAISRGDTKYLSVHRNVGQANFSIPLTLMELPRGPGSKRNRVARPDGEDSALCRHGPVRDCPEVQGCRGGGV